MKLGGRRAVGAFILGHDRASPSKKQDYRFENWKRLRAPG